MRSFRSDNNAGVCPEALRAMQECGASGHAVGYGDDDWTARGVAALRERFGSACVAFFVPTGTIGNTLLIAALTDPWQRVLCHAWSHWNDDESTAPELFTQCRTTPIEASSSTLTPQDVRRAASTSRGDVHQPQPGALTISNPTEFGEVYAPAQMRELCACAHELGYVVHVDGARFANAVAHLGCEPAEIASEAGVDALTFGGTKNGLALGEAALLFPQGDRARFERAVERMPYLRKRAGALLSKHRFVSAPIAATLEGDVWLAHAGRANEMASRLSEGLRALGVEPAYRTQANAVFVRLPERVHDGLSRRGHGYYLFGNATEGMARLMCSFDTRAEDVDAFVSDVRELLGESG